MTHDAITHGYTFIFRDGHGVITIVSFDGSPTHEAATRHLAEILASQGYTPPKWWQFWRDDETRPNSELKAAVLAIHAANAAMGAPV